MSGAAFVVCDGEAWPLGSRPLPARHRLGLDWLVVCARDAAQALALGAKYDAGRLVHRSIFFQARAGDAPVPVIDARGEDVGSVAEDGDVDGEV